MARDWIRSSGLTVTMDLLIFELVPPLLFATLGIMYGQCSTSKAIIYSIVVSLPLLPQSN